jgi:TatD DNase family protein
MKYFDVHCHPQFPIYDADRDAVLKRMHDVDMGGLIVGTERESSKAAVALADGITTFASVGVHPNHEADEWYEESNYLPLAEDPKVVAIGECGLDYFRPEALTDEVKEKQKALFTDHVRLAAKVGKPLMIHARPSKGSDDSYEDALTILNEFPQVRANFHFFVGSAGIARRIAELGHTCSFTAVLTFTKDYDDVIRTLPLRSILSETDAPYVAPLTNRGRRNEPTAVIEVIKAIARIRGEEEETVRAALLENASRVFSLPVAP